MAENGVHYLSYNRIKERLADNAIEYEKASAELKEAIAMGDLRENSEYDAAKERMHKVTQERDELSMVLAMPQVCANDNATFFEEGSVMELKVFTLTPVPMNTKGEEFQKMVETVTPIFEGVILFGGTLPLQELLSDSALSAETPIGKELLGRQPGYYSFKVPGGFANLSAKKLKSNEFKLEDIKCVYRG